MKSRLVNTIASASLIALSGTALAGTTVSSGHKAISANKSGIAQCVSAVRKYHDSSAKLMLSHRGSVRQLESDKVYTVNGYVWKDGDRVAVSHQCRPVSARRVALQIEYAGEQQLAAQQ